MEWQVWVVAQHKNMVRGDEKTQNYGSKRNRWCECTRIMKRSISTRPMWTHWQKKKAQGIGERVLHIINSCTMQVQKVFNLNVPSVRQECVREEKTMDPTNLMMASLERATLVQLMSGIREREWGWEKERVEKMNGDKEREKRQSKRQKKNSIALFWLSPVDIFETNKLWLWWGNSKGVYPPPALGKRLTTQSNVSCTGGASQHAKL